MMLRPHTLALFTALVLAVPAHALTQTPEPGFSEADVPPALKDWVRWATHDVKPPRCPFAYNNQAQRSCVMPGSLSLTLSDTGGHFTYRAVLFDEGWLTLSGNADTWPQHVQANTDPLVIVEHDGAPAAFLPAGTYVISGDFSWVKPPESIPLPAGVALVEATMNGERIAYTGENGNQLWLQKPQEVEAAKAEENSVNTKIFRKFTDSVPLMVDTRINVQVSGAPREEAIGFGIPEGATPIAVSGDLPARIEADGTVKAQLQPGNWSIDITSYYLTPRVEVTHSRAGDEVWVFDAQPALRLAEVSGVAAIDPSQTELPEQWRGLPAYFVRSGETMKIEEKLRGGAETPNQLDMTREWWLHMDGSRVSMRDTMQGSIGHYGRLEAQPGMQPGRIAVRGRDQFITQVSDGSPGIELRPGLLTLSADSRFVTPNKDAVSTFPLTLAATGWQEDATGLRATLHLPPGWSLLHENGADSVSYSWIRQWTLLDIFLVLVSSVILLKLTGLLPAVLGSVALVLLHHALPGLTPLTLCILGMIGLLNVLPQGRFRSYTVFIRRVLLFILVITALPFMVAHLRYAIYPQLLHSQVTSQEVQPYAPAPMELRKARRADMPQVMSSEPSYDAREMKDSMNESVEAYGSAGTAAQMATAPASLPPPPPPVAAKQEQPMDYDPSALISTGYGIPSWQGNTIEVTWSGPVARDQLVRFWLLPPWLNIALAFTGVILLASLLATLLGVPLSRREIKAFAQHGGFRKLLSIAAVMLAMSAAVLPDARAEEYPPQAMLDALKAKFTTEWQRPAFCLPECASISNAVVEIKDGGVVINMDVHADESVTLPLPGGYVSFRPDNVSVGGMSTSALRAESDGYLYLHLPAGVHHVEVRGRMPRDGLSLAFPLKARSLRVAAPGHAVHGIRADGGNDGTISVRPLVKDAGVTQDQDKPSREQQVLPALLIVERTLSLGTSWQVDTVVRRLSPEGRAVMASIPLLPTETVLTRDQVVKDKHIEITLDPQATEYRWSSRLDIASPIELAAVDANANPGLTEIWHVRAGTLWNVKAEGIPAIQAAAGDPALTFRPWPGERVSLAVVRPEGMSGQTLTIDKTVLDVTPGQRMQEGSLEIVLRSSQGGQHVVALPEGAELKSATLNGIPTQLAHDGTKVTLPLSPGKQTYVLKWQSPKGIAPLYRLPAVDVSLPSVNAFSTLNAPPGRWILALRGPSMGPAVLFWAWIPLVLIAAFALSRTKLTPLRFRHWLLLLLGLTQTDLETNVIIVGWLLALGWRERHPIAENQVHKFNLIQLVLGFWTLISLSLLFAGIRDGLLGSPDMKIEGNGSWGTVLYWYQDVAAQILPQAMMLSLPIFAYRVLMLLWALWLAFAFTRLSRWVWQAFSSGGYWRKWERKKVDGVEKKAEEKTAD